ncbi:MAG: MOMP family protein [Simkaniaceae bacterium]|nr:MAG: MOMP family protein [Simkaniaceae bacterium]
MKRYTLLAALLPLLSYAHEAEDFPRPPKKEMTVEAQPWVKNCVAEPYLEADFIYWEVKEDGLEYISSGYGMLDNPVTSRGKIYFPDFKKSPGFRVGVGLNLAHDGWDVFLRYTWLYSRAKDSQEGSFSPIWTHSPNPLLSEVTHASVDWKIHLDVLDLEWGRNFYISRFLTLRPYFGLKGYWSDQNYVNQNQGILFIDNQTMNRGSQLTKYDQDAWGIGIRFGINTAWYLVRNWSVFANVAFANEWSRFDLKRRDIGTNLDQGVEALLVHTRLKDYYMVPIIELATGVRWEMWFNDDSYHALIQAGWEEQVWFDMNRMAGVFDDTSGRGYLQLQGLTFKFRFDF